MVEIHLLVRTSGHAHPPAATAVLVDENDAVLDALVHRSRRARRDARRVQAVLADARQIEHEGLLEFEPDLLADLLQDRIVGHDLRGAAEVVVPVRRPFDLHRLAADQTSRRRHRDLVAERRGGEVLVVVGPRLVVVVDRRHLRIREDPEELVPPAAVPQPQPPVAVADPSAPPAFLVLVGARVSLAGAGLDVVEPHVLGAGSVGPGLLTGDRAGMAADALVEVHHHRHLGHHLHAGLASLVVVVGIDIST
ncbi:conserved hypothetical protein [Rhodococcus ruber]|uniref:Uncharacterized protein n=1 Tax=Rhodococcus ruber TaxID=1830 RepID=A0A098BJ37_9NOCA|nr:conserved hypothetical protein [Rhodococcus ruber]